VITFAAADAAAFAGAAAAPTTRSPRASWADGRFVRMVGKRARAQQRAQRAATAAAAALLTAEMQGIECAGAMASLAATIAEHQRRLDLLRVQRLLCSDLVGGTGALRVAAEHLRLTLGPNAMGRLSLCELDTRAARLSCRVDEDAARRRLTRLRRRWLRIYDSLQSRLRRLRSLRRSRGPPLVAGRARLAAAARV